MATDAPARQTPDVQLRKLSTTDAFVVTDLEGAERAVGIVRLAPKILRDGATLLARTATYQQASFGWKVAGASAGINATPDGRDEAVAAFVAELAEGGAPLVLLDAAKGVTDDDLAPLRPGDPRPALHRTWGHRLVGLSAAVAADAALGGLDGRRLAVERLDDVGTAFVAEATARGAVVVAVGAAKGSVIAPDGLSAAEVVAAGTEHGEAGVDQLGTVDPTAWITAADADVVAVGSKAGVVDHTVAAGVRAGLLVPVGAVPVTARGLAVARRQGCTVLPDFLTTAGAALAMWADADATVESLGPVVDDQVGGAVREVLGHDEGPLLGACERAEAFLATWQDELPFGRPLA